jgi:hypothetical protein
MAKDANEITLLERRVLSLLPFDGEKMGGHTLKKPVRAMVEDLHYEVTAARLNGLLRGLTVKGLVRLVEDERKNKAAQGWVATAEGREAISGWDGFLTSYALVQAQRSGDGLAEIRTSPDGPVVGYVMTQARYGRVADDPAGGKTVVVANVKNQEG